MPSSSGPAARIRRLFVLGALVGAAIGGSNCGSSTATSVTAADPPPRCQVTVSGSPASFPASGGTGTVSVDTNRDCTWSASPGASWISLSGNTNGQGAGSFPFSVAANSVVSARTGTIAVNGQNFTVSEQAAPCTFAVSPTTVSVPATGGTAALSVQSPTGCAWTATSSVPFVTVTSGGSGNGNGSVTLTVAANNGAARSTTMSVAGQSVVVTQAAAAGPPPPPPSCTFSISPSSQNFSAAGGTGSVSVSAANGCAWTATSGASFVTITSGAQGTGNGSVLFTVAANTGAARTTTLTIAGRAFTVTEAAPAAPPPPPPACAYAVSPQTASIGAGGGQLTIAVSTTAGCTWSATSTVSWMTIASGATGSGSGTVTVSVARNNGGARTGTLTVAGQTVTVTEAAGNTGGDNVVG